VTESPASIGATSFLQLWAESLQEVLAQIAAAPCPAQLLDSLPEASPEVAKNDSDFHFIITADGALRGEMSVRFAVKTALALGQLLLGEEQKAAAELSSDHRDAALELFRQVAGLAASKVASRFGETPFRVEAGPPPTWAAASTAWICSGSDSKVAFQLEWQLSSALTATLLATQEKAIQEKAAQQPGAPGSSKDFPASGPSLAAANLDLFNDVELDVTMRFGGRRMLLREILELGPGSVVELDRQVQEPVDLLLDGKIIARGEVVVVEGNYGLRVLEVMSSS
jgi:flagellar motor switch protein FliN